jgi:hypothetical protein
MKDGLAFLFHEKAGQSGSPESTGPFFGKAGRPFREGKPEKAVE